LNSPQPLGNLTLSILLCSYYPYLKRRRFKCDQINKLIDLLKGDQVLSKTNQKAFVVLDKAEKLRGMGFSLLPTLLRLDELIPQKKICVILISSISWDHFLNGTGLRDPIPILFDVYSKQTVTEIICQQNPLEDQQLLKNLTNIVWNTFHSVSTDLRELRLMVKILFPKYVEPILTGKVKDSSNTRVLYNRIHPFLEKGVLHNIYLRQLTPLEVSKLGENQSTKLENASLACHLAVETKYLLLAAYLASVNPPKLDQRLFGKVNTAKTTTEKMRNKHTGRAFVVNRMLAIFKSIADIESSYDIEVYAQISTLMQLSMLTRVSPVGTLQNPKLKCNVGSKFIISIAESLNFDLSRYTLDS